MNAKNSQRRLCLGLRHIQKSMPYSNQGLEKQSRSLIAKIHKLIGILEKLIKNTGKTNLIKH